MTDYKALYYALFGSIADAEAQLRETAPEERQALLLLEQLQKEAEERYLAAGEAEQ